MSEPAITLYRLQACPFCERVVRVLEDLDLAYRSRFVEPMHSDRDVVKRISGSRTVPVLVDERTGVTLSESDHVVSCLDRTYRESNDVEDVEEVGAVEKESERSTPRVDETATAADAAEDAAEGAAEEAAQGATGRTTEGGAEGGDR